MPIDVKRIGKYGNISEELAVNQLLLELQNADHQNAIILVNPRIPTKWDQQRETDLILLYKYGVVVIEVKNWIGPIDFSKQDGCGTKSRFRIDPRRQAIDCKNALMTFLARKNCRPTVNCMVWFMSDTVQINYSDNFSAPVHLLSSGARFVASGEIARRQYNGNLANEQQLRPEQLQKLKNHLCGVKSDSYIKTVRNYRILQEIGGPLHTEYSASHLDSQEDLSVPRIRLKKHRLPPIDTEDRLLANEQYRADSLRAARRLYQVLDTLDKVPGIPSVRDCFPDPNDDTVIWTAYKFVNGCSLDDFCKNKHATDVYPLCASIAGTLQACHEKGIVHRTLTQKSIVVPSNEPNPIPILLGFDFARIKSSVDSYSQPSIGAQIYEAAYKSYYAAPEVRANVSNADARSDIYSFGIVALEVFLRRLLEKISVTKIENGLAELRTQGIASDVVDLLSSMTQADPSLRPTSMADVMGVFLHQAGCTANGSPLKRLPR